MPHKSISAWYLERYPDVAAAGVDPVQHFLIFGHAEGRSPSEFLDPVWYLSAYPDVADKREDPVLHYVRDGWKEGRNPGPKFDVQRYLAAYPELAGSGQDPLAHYLKSGRHQGRQPFAVPDAIRHDESLSKPLIQLLDEDVSNAISEIYKSHVGRQPSSHEVGETLGQLKEGANLGDVVHSILSNEEASAFARRKSAIHSRGVFSAVMQIIYRNFLERSISETEVDHYFSGYKSGEDFFRCHIKHREQRRSKRCAAGQTNDTQSSRIR